MLSHKYVIHSSEITDPIHALVIEELHNLSTNYYANSRITINGELQISYRNALIRFKPEHIKIEYHVNSLSEYIQYHQFATVQAILDNIRSHG